MGVEPGGTVPPALRSALKQLEEDQKRRATRGLRDGVDRVLVDLLSRLPGRAGRAARTRGLPPVNAAWADRVDAARRRHPPGRHPRRCSTRSATPGAGCPRTCRRCSRSRRCSSTTRRWRGTRRMRRAAGARSPRSRVAAPALLLSGCAWFPRPTSRPRPTPVTDVAARAAPTTASALVWKDCGGGFRCTTAARRWTGTTRRGPRIRLALIAATRRPATGSARCSSNPGGPGVSGVDFLRSSATPFFDPTLLDSYDMVGVGPPRGRPLHRRRLLRHREARRRSCSATPDLPDGSDRGSPST